MPTPTNNRVYWPCQAVGIAKFSAPNTITTVRGCQNVGLSGRISVTFVQEMGNISTYSSFEELPEVEITIEKDLDGYCPVYLLATQDAPTTDIAGRSNQRCHTYMSIHSDNVSRASGSQVAQVFCSGTYASSVGYDFMVNGAFKESVTLVGNNVVWTTGSYVFTGHTAAMGVTSLAPAYSGGVARRQHFNMPASLFPLEIPGISSSGTNDVVTVNGNSQFAVSFDSIKTNVSFGRTSKLELGHKQPYFRFVEFPVDVSTSFDFICKQGALVNFLEAGTLANGDNTSPQTIYLKTMEGLTLDLGTKNRLVSDNQSGGQAGGKGSDVMLSFSYTNQNDFTVKHINDATVALQG